MSETEFRPSVLWVTPEAAPYASTGGLAEVAGAMPRSLHAQGWPVALLMPCYTEKCSANDAPEILSIQPMNIELAGRVFETEIVHALGHGGLPLRMLRYDPFFARPGIYSEGAHDYPDNHLRFALLCKAACELAKLEGFEVLHLNDWPAALTAVLLATHYRDDPALSQVRVLQSIHNLAHPGSFETRTLDDLGLSQELALWNFIGHEDEASWLKGGLLLADALHTVSPRYSREILTPEFGAGMDGLLRLRGDRMHGVLNGLDYEEWTPDDTTQLTAPFSIEDLSGKAKCKNLLIDKFGLKKRTRIPLVAYLGRMAPQKGLDLLLEAAPSLLAKGAQILIVGSGRPDLEARCRALAENHPGEVAVYIGFERSLAQQITAGADMVVMPSRFEPCGLTQMQAMRYGTIPVVHEVGGLADTVCNTTSSSISANKATGFVFQTFSTRALSLCLGRALKAYRERRLWERLMRNAMRQDFSWSAVMPGYETMYRSLFDHEPWRFGIDLPIPGHAAPTEPAPFIDWGPELPDRYHRDAIQLMVQSPTQMYVYWEVQPGRVAPDSVRVRVDRESESWIAGSDMNEVGELWIDAVPDHSYRVRIEDAAGEVLLESNVVHTPRDTPSEKQETRWIAVEERRRRHLEASRRRTLQRGEEVPPWGIDEFDRWSRQGGSSDLSQRPGEGER